MFYERVDLFLDKACINIGYSYFIHANTKSFLLG